MAQQHRLKRQVFNSAVQSAAVGGSRASGTPASSSFGDSDALGYHARDTQQIFSAIPVQEQRIVETIYNEPLVIGNLKEEPFSIKLERIINLFAPPTPVRCGSMCHFTWDPKSGGAQITSIDGLSMGFDHTVKFRFFFVVTYKLN